MQQKSINLGFLLFFLFGVLLVQLLNPAFGQAGVDVIASPPDAPVVLSPALDQLSLTAAVAESVNAEQAPATDEPASNMLWNLFIAIIVLLVTGSTAALCLAAMRQWQGYWRAIAGAPVAVLLVWVAVIILSVIAQPESHRLWPFEIFAWAMMTSVYMMLLMTAKKTFNKADAEKAQNAQRPSE